MRPSRMVTHLLWVPAGGGGRCRSSSAASWLSAAHQVRHRAGAVAQARHQPQPAASKPGGAKRCRCAAIASSPAGQPRYGTSCQPRPPIMPHSTRSGSSQPASSADSTSAWRPCGGGAPGRCAGADDRAGRVQAVQAQGAAPVDRDHAGRNPVRAPLPAGSASANTPPAAGIAARVVASRSPRGGHERRAPPIAQQVGRPCGSRPPGRPRRRARRTTHRWSQCAFHSPPAASTVDRPGPARHGSRRTRARCRAWRAGS